MRHYSSDAHVFLISFSVVRLFSGTSWLFWDMTLGTTLSHTIGGTIHFLEFFLVTHWAELDLDGGNTRTTSIMLCATVSSTILTYSTCHSSPLQMTSSMQGSLRRAGVSMKKTMDSGQVFTESSFHLICSLAF